MSRVVRLVKMIVLEHDQVFLSPVRVLKKRLKCLPAFKYLHCWMKLFAVDHLKWALRNFKFTILAFSFKSVQKWVHHANRFALLPQLGGCDQCGKATERVPAENDIAL